MANTFILWLDNGHPDLFDLALSGESTQRLLVALDANVFFDLEGAETDDDSESVGLKSDWLQPQIELCVTAELLNEIGRCEDPKVREQQRRAASTQYRLLRAEDKDFHPLVSRLNDGLGPPVSQSDESDRRQLARAAASCADFFVTRDTGLLEKAVELYDLIGVTLLRPYELVAQIDALLRAQDYQPRRLMGSHLYQLEQSTVDLNKSADKFLSHATGERRSDFLATLRGLASHPRQAVLQTVVDADGAKIGLLGYETHGCDELVIRLCRVVPGRIAGTLAGQLLDNAVRHAINERRMICRVTDAHPLPIVTEVLSELGFKAHSRQWFKANLDEVESFEVVIAKLESIQAKNEELTLLLSEISRSLKYARARGDIEGMIAIERALRPLKIVDLELPVYIIPIEAAWASHLFDDELATDQLFSGEPELMFRRSNAYYRSAHPGGINAPGRILWYVKQKAGIRGTMAIRAVSYLDEVVVEKPKPLFRRLQRLGVYEWRDVFAIARENPEAKVMALLFSGKTLAA